LIQNDGLLASHQRPLFAARRHQNGDQPVVAHAFRREGVVVVNERRPFLLAAGDQVLFPIEYGAQDVVADVAVSTLGCDLIAKPILRRVFSDRFQPSTALPIYRFEATYCAVGGR
jgi:hypothetical protein